MDLDTALEGHEVTYGEALQEIDKHAIIGDEVWECLNQARIKDGVYSSAKILHWLGY